ncbi:unnamed protein product, partial [Tilletia caries]
KYRLLVVAEASAQHIKGALEGQLDAAEKGRPQSDLTALRKETGIKDSLTTKYCDDLIQLRKDLQQEGRRREHIDQAAHDKRREIESGNWYGPLLRLYGLLRPSD